MKYLIASDIHGSSYYCEKIIEESKKVDFVVLLGDIYYHGPRNPLPEDYNPMKVSQLLNGITKKLMVVKGNCDAEVDQIISDFKIKNNIKKTINSKIVYFTHGHKYNIDNTPKTNYDIMFYGHFHTPFIKQYDNKIFVNPGSVSLPKENTEHSFAIFDNKSIVIKNFNGKILDKIDL